MQLLIKDLNRNLASIKAVRWTIWIAVVILIGVTTRALCAWLKL
jgi:hypothetical protein